MAPRKKEALSAAKATVESVEHEARKLQQKARSLDRMHPVVRFVLVLITSLALNSALFTLTSSVTLGELGSVSKHLQEWWEVAGLIAWKAVEIGLAMVMGFDGRDVTAFIFLTHLPTYSLLASFYHIRPTTVLLSYGITLGATTLPFIFLCRPSPFHRSLSHASSPTSPVANRSILQDRPTTIYTTLAATSIFTVVLYLAYATVLPTQLVLHFHDIPDISAAHAGPAGLPILFLALVPAGCAARDFLFVSSAGSLSKKQEQAATEPSREGEYLACAVYRSTWGALSMKTRVLVSRTVVLAAVLVLNTVVQLAGTVRGVDVEGASAWGAVWAVATVAVGVTFGWIEAVDGV
ncbi:hypothetical protein FE257_005097 [Aspergillus nanangensis]|uniref:Uncharacterized protein n=1 Tax=Aspergillus nanangensis TaxID=2582783 RepID=A0AAD4GVU5_ASPNN|nr:hypothetical protein FE257_005097 [Aspergillus nanangensis]